MSRPAWSVGVLCIVLSASGCAAEAGRKPNGKKHGAIMRTGILVPKQGKALPFKVEVAISKLSDNEVRQRTSTRIFGGGGRGQDNQTSRVINDIQLTVGGRSFQVPANGLIDLTEPNLPETLAVSTSNNEIVIGLEGAAGEFYYQCRFYASEARFHKRVLNEPLNPKYQNVVLKF